MGILGKYLDPQIVVTAKDVQNKDSANIYDMSQTLRSTYENLQAMNTKTDQTVGKTDRDTMRHTFQ